MQDKSNAIFVILNLMKSLLSLNKNTVFAILLAFFGAGVVLFYRFDAAQKYAVQFPVAEQWSAEYNDIYKPYFENNLSPEKLFIPNNEHIIAVQKIAHLFFLIFTNEWNPLFQIYFNAFLYAILIFIIIISAGINFPNFYSLPISCIAVLSGIIPTASENFLWGFQTGWYIYYLLGLSCIYCIFRSSGIDRWLLCGIILASLSCFCLAAGIINLFLCVFVLLIKNLFESKPFKIISKDILICVSLVAVQIFIVFFVAQNGRIAQQSTSSNIINNIWFVSTWPLFILPLIYSPAVLKLMLYINLYFNKINCKLNFFDILALWALLHAVILIAGRGVISSRHIELLTFGLLANAFLLFSAFQMASKYLQKSRNCDVSFNRFIQKFPPFWFAAVVAGCFATIIIDSGMPKYFKSEYKFNRYENVKRWFIEKHIPALNHNNELQPLAKVFKVPQIIQNEILNSTTLNNIFPNFHLTNLILNPPIDHSLLFDTMEIYPDAFPFMTWLKTPRKINKPWSQECVIENIKTPFLKILWTGRNDNKNTGIYSLNNNASPLPSKSSFSQADGWRSVFVPVQNGRVDIRVVAFDQDDWVLLQQPIPCSALQYYLEALGRKSSSIYAFFLGIFVFIVSFNLFYLKMIDTVHEEVQS